MIDYSLPCKYNTAYNLQPIGDWLQEDDNYSEATSHPGQAWGSDWVPGRDQKQPMKLEGQ